MGITLMMTGGKTLHFQDATAAQVELLRQNLNSGHGIFEFSIEDRSYFVNCAHVLYMEVTPPVGS